MTVSNTQIRVSYTGDGASTSFPLPFPFYLSTDIEVLLAGVEIFSGFSITGGMDTTGASNPGALVMASAPATGVNLQAILSVPLTQLVKLVDGTAFPSATLNQVNDRAVQAELRLQDQISRSVRAPDGDVSPSMLLPPAAIRALQYSSFDANGNATVTSTAPGTANTPATLGPLFYPRSQAEINAAVFPAAANMVYLWGDLRRYGAVGGPWGSCPTTDDSLPWAIAASTRIILIPQGMAFKVVTGANVTGQVTVQGYGRTSEVYCDGAILSVTGGTGSYCDNFWMGNITAPWVVTRNPASWNTVIPFTSLVQSNTQLGYQPTVNDPEYTTWVSAIPAVGTQNIGPVLYFSGAASDITVSRIKGRFVRVEIRDAINSTIELCTVRGGKGQWGVLAFDNWQNGIQRGSGNRLINNRVQYGSFSGLFFASNDDFVCSGNYSFRNGESGVKTNGCAGASFSASVAGATTGTISVPVGGFTNGAWTFVFEGNQTRTVTITGNTTATWTGALGAGNTVSASVYNTTLNPQCFRGQVEDNYTYQNYYDGLDASATFNTTVDAPATYYQFSNNYSYNNGGNGIDADGRYNQYVGNYLYNNQAYGFWGICSFSLIKGNHIGGNNVGNNSSVSDLLGGTQGNSITGNFVVYGASAGFPIFAAQQATQVPHVATDNVVIGGTANWGNPEAIYPVLSNNIDATTGARTRQSGIFIIQNSAGTLQHAFYNDVTLSGPASATRIVGNTSGGFTNTPTGTDASTAFAAGAKVSTNDTNGVVLNTAPQWNMDVDFEARVVINSTTTALTVSVSFESFSVNGVTQYRPLFRFWNATTGAAFVINTTNIGASTFIKVEFTGYLS